MDFWGKVRHQRGGLAHCTESAPATGIACDRSPPTWRNNGAALLVYNGTNSAVHQPTIFETVTQKLLHTIPFWEPEDCTKNVVWNHIQFCKLQPKSNSNFCKNGAVFRTEKRPRLSD